MLSLHGLNIAVHVAAGSVALLIGFAMLVQPKGTATHRWWGRRFGAVTLVVCASAAIGSAFFRFMPLFAVLNVVVTYQLVSGWRVARTRAAGPRAADALWTFLGLGAAVALVPVLLRNPDDTPGMILWPTLGALALLLGYDALRWLFPRRWHARVWVFEHIYKIVSALFAMLSAMVGNVVRFGQPWSQILPTVLGALVITWFFVAQIRGRGRVRAPRPETSAGPLEEVPTP